MSALPTVVAVGTVANGVGTITPGIPAGTRIGDILVMFLETSDQAITVSGWTQALSSPQSETTDVTRLTIFWKRADGTGPASITSDSGDHQVGRIIGIRGCIAYGDPFNITAGSTDATSNTSMSIPGVTTTVANTLVLTACGITRDLVATTNFATESNASLGTLTERMDNAVADGTGGGFGVYSGTKAVAGATGSTTATIAVASRKTYWTGALLPAVPLDTYPHKDNFDNNSTDTVLWLDAVDTGVTVSETGQLLQNAIVGVGAGSYGYRYSAGYWDVTGQSVWIQATNAGNQALQLDYVPVNWYLDASNWADWIISGNVIIAHTLVAGVDTNVKATDAYLTATHKWFSIREGPGNGLAGSPGTLYWDYSTDGKVWTNYTSVANPFAMTAIVPRQGGGIWGTAGTTTLQYDNFRCNPSQVVYSRNRRNVLIRR